MSSKLGKISFQEIQDKEREVLRHRKTDAEPTVGLALSGGGIRSATFNLGILQVLEKAKILPLVDYLSTVSGGGYAGGYFLANRFRGRELSTDKDEPSLKHLRRFSNYLTPSMGLFSTDTWTMVMIWLRNAGLLQAFLICVFACVLLSPRFFGWLLWNFGLNHADASVWLTWGGVGAVALLQVILLFLCHGLIVSWDTGSGDGDGRPLWLKKSSGGGEQGEYAKPAALVIGSIIGSALLTPSIYCSIGAAGSEHSLAVLFAATMAGTAFPLALYSLGFARGFTASPALAGIVGLVVLALNPAVWVKQMGGSPDQLLTLIVAPVAAQALIFAIAPFALCKIERAEKVNDLGRSLLAAVVCGAVAFGMIHLAFAVLADAVAGAKLHAAEGPTTEFFWHYAMFASPGVLVAIAVCLTVMIGIVGRAMPDLVREAWSRMAALLLLTSGLIFGAAVIGIYAPFGMLSARDALNSYITGAGGAAAALASVLSLLAARSGGTSGKKEDHEKAGMLDKAKSAMASLAPVIFIALLLFSVALGAHLVLAKIVGGAGGYWSQLGQSVTGWAGWLLFAACAGVAMLVAWRVDVNEFSLNRFYRNRLVRCFLGAARADDLRSPNQFTGFDFNDDLQMCELRKHLEGGSKQTPIPIVNTALNAVGGEDAVLTERRAHSLFFTPFHAFSVRTGGMKIQDITTGRFPDDVSLGSVISISGAAANPNMGFHSSPPIAFLLTFFNVRLGWWLRNVNADSTWIGRNFSLVHSFSELLGTATDNDAYVNLSDGGHFENLGLYELIRRECELIVVGDGEQDGEFSFGSLGMAIRRCRVDFGAEIDVRVADLRPAAPSQTSAHHFVSGKIQYRSGKMGTLLYFKSSYTGREPYDVEQYKRENPAFPHQSTGDQFFSESQFESYRQLGMHAAMEFLAEVKPRNNSRANLCDSIRDWQRGAKASAATAQ